jgi:hypothetical protein
LVRRVDDFAGIARHVTHHKVELGNANLKGHTGAGIQFQQLCHRSAGFHAEYHCGCMGFFVGIAI